ncbi:MAG TPA: hypothetical protein VMF90_12245 [Rhizobiaceae bacterium]|nr:hypothetical protein [Rhizobiaceae bacterium]
MASDLEKFDKTERAKRLRQARVAAGFTGPTPVVEAAKGAVKLNNYKAHEQGRNGYSISEGRVYADLFGVPLTWLYLGIGAMKDAEIPGATPELKRVFARLVSAPEDLQQRVITSISFLLPPAGSKAQQSPAEPDDRPKRTSRPRAKAPS